MNYKQAVEYLERLAKLKIKNSFETLRLALAPFGSPQEQLRVIHIAGTNGKGSTCAMLSSVLREAGYKTGVFTSPHLTRYNERIRINGRQITNAAFADTLSRIVTKNPHITLSFFEMLTVMAFIHFHENKADYAVIETGIGGKRDSTNIVKKPVLSVITRIGLDHTALLGTSIKEIASQKAGIIKENCPAVLYSNTKQVYNVVRCVCKQKNSAFYYADDFSFNTLYIKNFAPFKRQNEKGVLTAVHALNQAGVCIRDTAVKRGLNKTKWPCRMEIISREPFVIIDGAHNPQGADAFNEAIDVLNITGRVILVAAVQKSKPFKEILKKLTKNADITILTRVNSAEFADDTDFKAEYTPDYKAALDKALALADKSDLICVAGSLYLAGAARGYLLKKLAKGNIPCSILKKK